MRQEVGVGRRDPACGLQKRAARGTVVDWVGRASARCRRFFTADRPFSMRKICLSKMDWQTRFALILWTSGSSLR